MTDLLSLGASGVRAYQSALGVVGENIANTSTPGYVRRDVVLKEISPGRGFVTQIERGITGGVNMTGVARQWNVFQAAEVRRSTADAAGTESAIPWLQRVETQLDKGGIASAMSGFFTSASALAADPASAGPRAAMVEQANGLASAFRSTASGLDAIRDDVGIAISEGTAELSRLARGLAEANSGVARARPGSNGQAQLMDERDRLIDQMSALAKIDVTYADNGVATVRLGEPGGPVLVDRGGAGSVTAQMNADGSTIYALHKDGERQVVGIPSGALAGVQEASSRIASARREVDRIATDFATGVNAVQAGGIDLNGATGVAMFSTTGAANLTMQLADGRGIAAAAPLTSVAAPTNRSSATLKVTPDPAAATPTAMPVRLSYAGGDLVATDPVTNTVLGRVAATAGATVTVAGLNVTLTGTPAEADGFTVRATGAGSRDAGNLSALADLRRGGGYERDFDGLVTTNASQLAQRRLVADAQVAIRDGAAAARDSASGVNLDNEAVELMRFQQAYSASSRIIQVARETFQSILDASR